MNKQSMRLSIFTTFETVNMSAVEVHHMLTVRSLYNSPMCNTRLQTPIFETELRDNFTSYLSRMHYSLWL